MILEEIERIYFTLADVASELGTTMPKIRFYEKELGIEIKRSATRHNKRFYTRDDIEKMRKAIKLAKYLRLPAVKKVLDRRIADKVLELLER